VKREKRSARIVLSMSLLVTSLAVALSDVVSNNSKAIASSAPTTLGRQFSFVFPPSLGSEVMRIYISSARDGSATWQVGNGASTTVSLTANVATTVTLPNDSHLQSGSGTTEATVSDKMIRVTTTVDASVYADSNDPVISDAAGILPDANLGTRYRMLAPLHDTWASRMTVLALENSTSVTITPKTVIGAKSAGTSFTVSLSAGQAYTLPTNATNQQVSGSTVESTKPVAVFSSADCMNGSGSFPFVSRNQIGACDFMFEQVPPVQSWGRSFILNGFADRKQGGTPIRFVADQDNTVVAVNGTTVATLNAGNVYQYNYWEASVAQSVAKNEGIYLTATKPILVSMYMRGGGNYMGQTGDPAMAFVPPFEQFLTNYTVVSAPGNAAQLMNVWIPTAAISSLRFDGAALTASNFESGSVNWHAVPGTSYSVAQLASTLGSHNLTANMAFGLLVYGANSYNSYAYIGGMSLSPIGLVESVTLTTSASYTGSVGQETCIEVNVLDANGVALPGVRVDGAISGANSGTPLVGTTQANGVAQMCYVGSSAGSDSVTLTSNQLSTSTTVTWTQVAPSVTYTPSVVSVVKNSAMNTLNPTNVGSPATSWQINPSLPSGLSLSASGVISGTPTIASVSTSYTVSATNAAGTSTTTVTIEVTDNAVAASISYSPSTYSLTLNQVINTISPTVSGTFPSWTVAPALPIGLTLNAQNGKISGTPQEETASASYTVTATNAAGSVNTSITISVGLVAPDISYAQSTVSYVKDTAIASLLPSNAGSVAASWSVSPALPTGLAFNSNTGQISGTPTAVASAANYTVTATNSAGSDTFTVNITVTAALASPDITYSVSTLSLNVSVAMSALIPTNTGGPASSWSISPALPSGLSFTASTGRISGTPSAVASAANYTVTATNSAGFDTFVINVEVVSQTPSAPVISYSSLTHTLTVGLPMTNLTPTNTGGSSTSWSVSTQLPTGINFDSTTGTISGTPSVATPSTSYVITATNGGGSDTVTLSISVVASSTTTLPSSISGATTTTVPVSTTAPPAQTTTTTIAINRVSMSGRTAVHRPGSATTLLSVDRLETEMLITQTPNVCIVAGQTAVMLRNGTCIIHIYSVPSMRLVRIWKRTVSDIFGGILLNARNSLTTRFAYRSAILRNRIPSSIVRATKDADHIIVSAHTAIFTGDNAWNTQLSRKRAEAVKAALLRAGVEIPIYTTALGAKSPVTRVMTEDAQRRNRRAEIYVVNKPGTSAATATLIGIINY